MHEVNCTINVRQATVTDVESIILLNGHVQTKHVEWYPNIFHNTVTNKELHKFFTTALEAENGIMFIAEVNEGISGMLWCEYIPEHKGVFAHRKPSLHIHHIVVDPKKGREGIGTRLLESANILAKDKNCAFIRLDTWARNQDAQHFFEASGFEVQRLTYTKPINGRSLEIIRVRFALLSHLMFLSWTGVKHPDVREQGRSSVSGGDGYISPDWYGVADQVPTWNYVAVHLRGRLRLLPDDDLRGVLERLSSAMEARLAPKPIWKIDKVSDEALSKMMRQIIPIAMDVDDIDGTWKLGQNKSDEARLGAAEALALGGFGLEYKYIADLMKDPPS